MRNYHLIPPNFFKTFFFTGTLSKPQSFPFKGETPNVTREEKDQEFPSSVALAWITRGILHLPPNRCHGRSSGHTLSRWVFKCLDADKTRFHEILCPEWPTSISNITDAASQQRLFIFSHNCCQLCRIGKGLLGQKDLSSDLPVQCSSQKKFFKHCYCKKGCFHTCVLLSIWTKCGR